MPTPRQRSRSTRKVFKKLPGGRLAVHYELKKPGLARCASCHLPLGGVPRERPHRVRKLARTMRRPERLYGGVLCGQCTKRLLIERARVMHHA